MKNTLGLPLVALLPALICAMPALAAPACFTPEEARAEKILQLHSELMVITITCKQGSTGRDLVRAYTGLTRRHIKEIRAAERTLMDYFIKKSGGDGASHLDRLRTKLANNFGQQVADESAPAYCARRRDAVTALSDKTSTQAFAEALEAHGGLSPLAPPCSGTTKGEAAAKVNAAAKANAKVETLSAEEE